MISRAGVRHTNGLGSAFQCNAQRSIAAIRSATLVKTPRRSRLSVSSLNHGHPKSVNSLVSLVRTLPPHEQVVVGLPWISKAVLGDPSAIAGRCFLLTDWLAAMRMPSEGHGQLSSWQQVVDALVVAGEGRLAAYSE
jgi:hypothetical protein